MEVQTCYKEKALKACLKYKSVQTNFIHFNKEKPLGDLHDTIPIYENLLYTVALMRTHQVDHMQEGMRLLKHILFFQTEGLFPVYVHNFPFVKQGAHQVAFAAPLVILYRDYGHLLPQELFQKLKSSITRLSHAIKEIPRLDAFSEFKASLFSYAWGILSDHEALFPLKSWNELKITSSQQLSDLLIFFQLLLKSPMEKEVQRLLTLCCDHYHSPTRSFSGPFVGEMWNGYQPVNTLFHHVMNILFGHDLDASGNECMEFALIDFTSLSSINTKECNPINTYLESQLDECENPMISPFHHSFVSNGQVFHLATYAGPFRFSAKYTEGGVSLQFEITKEYDPSDCRDPLIKFYINYPEQVRLIVEGRPSTTFRKGESVLLIAAGKEIGLSFTSNREEGRHLGKICRANRPVQTNATKFDAYDLEIGIRSVKWQPGEVIQVQLYELG